jgi:hypothetical protein
MARSRVEGDVVAGKKITRETVKKLDQFGEDRVFELYSRIRSVRKLLESLTPALGKVSTYLYYQWLHDDKTKGRWNRWQAVRATVAGDMVEEGLNIVDSADDGTVPAARLRSEYRRWMAERYDRGSYGKTDNNMIVGISVGSEFLSALKQIEAEEAEHEIIVPESDD